MSLDEERIVAALPAYDIGEELGRGSWGIVLAGTHRQLGRGVAIKQLPREFGADPAVRRRFLTEGRLLASLDHPHIVPIYDFVENDGVCLFVMERLTGGTLWSRYKHRGLSAQSSCAAILATCAALHYAHSHGVLHRDVKPHNLMLSGEGVLKVTDFGIAKVVGGAETVATRAGQILGTPAYMAPEQAQSGELTPRTDVYATGMILYELLAGELAFPEDTDPISMLFRHVHEEPRPLHEVAPQVPRPLAAATMRAIQRIPEERYPSTEEFGIELARAAAEAWGSGWLASSDIGLVTGGHIRAAAVGGVATPSPQQMRSDGGTLIVEPQADGPTLPPVVTPPPLTPATPAYSPPPAAYTPPPTPYPPSTPPSYPPSTPPSYPPSTPPGTPPPMGAPPADLLETLAPSRTGPPSAPPTPSKRTRILLIAAPLAAVVFAVAAFFATRGGGGSGSSDFKLASQWRNVADLRQARNSAAAAEVGGVLWMAGGLTGKEATAKVEGYDPAVNTWKTGTDLPQPVHHATAVDFRNQLVVIGGWFPSDAGLEGTPTDQVLVQRGAGWAQLPKLNHPRAAAAAAVVGDEIVVVGGQANGRLVPETEVFDGIKWREGAPIPTPRERLAAAGDEEHLYAVGGRDLSVEKNLKTLERYDPKSNKWKKLESMPTARSGLGAAIAKGRLFAAGGEDPIGVFNAVEVYDIGGDEWSEQPDLRSPRHSLGIAAIGDDLYAVGGSNRPGDEGVVPFAEVLSATREPAAAAGQWQTLRDAPTARQQLAAAADDGKVWVAGGLLGEKATAKVEEFDPVADKWKAAPNLPIQLHHATAATYRGELIVMGGWKAEGTNLNVEVSNRVFALRNGGWEELPPLNYARAAAAATVAGDKLVIVGGQADGKLVPATEVFEGDRWRDVTPLPTPREHLAAASDGRFVYVVGGRDLSAAKNFGTLERYDPAADTWETLPAMPTARGGLGATIVDGRLVTVGGEDPTAAFDVVEVYDIAAKTWSALPSLHSPTHGMAVVGIDKSIYVAGGARRPGHKDSTAATEVLTL